MDKRGEEGAGKGDVGQLTLEGQGRDEQGKPLTPLVSPSPTQGVPPPVRADREKPQAEMRGGGGTPD